MIFNREGLRKYTYWKLESKPHEDDADQTASYLRDLLRDTVERQLVSDVPVCSCYPAVLIPVRSPRSPSITTNGRAKDKCTPTRRLCGQQQTF